MNYNVNVQFRVQSQHANAFRARVAEQAASSLTEPGCSVFDVWSDDATPGTFFLYEIYDDRAAFDAHLKTAHFLAFDAEVKDWVTDKRVETFGEMIAG